MERYNIVLVFYDGFIQISLCMCTVGTIYHKRTGSIKINMAEIKGCNSCIYQSTKNPPIDGVYFYPHTKASKFSTRKEWKRTECVRTLISSLERWCKTHYIISIDQTFISDNFLQKRFPIVLINRLLVVALRYVSNVSCTENDRLPEKLI